MVKAVHRAVALERERQLAEAHASALAVLEQSKHEALNAAAVASAEAARARAEHAEVRAGTAAATAAAAAAAERKMLARMRWARVRQAVRERALAGRISVRTQRRDMCLPEVSSDQMANAVVSSVAAARARQLREEHARLMATTEATQAAAASEIAAARDEAARLMTEATAHRAAILDEASRTVVRETARARARTRWGRVRAMIFKNALEKRMQACNVRVTCGRYRTHGAVSQLSRAALAAVAGARAAAARTAEDLAMRTLQDAQTSAASAVASAQSAAAAMLADAAAAAAASIASAEQRAAAAAARGAARVRCGGSRRSRRRGTRLMRRVARWSRVRRLVAEMALARRKRVRSRFFC